jgi:hypothetical protein
MRVDNTQEEIVTALRQAGARVWVIGQPCDLLIRHRGRWLLLECKSTKRRDKRQKLQAEFLMQNDVPVVTSPEEALAAVLM